MDSRATKRRALVVLTDGFDTASKLDAAEVSRIASSIDLPVYVRGGGAGDRRPAEPRMAETARSTAIWPIWRAGRVASCSSRRSRRKPSDVARRSSSELRQQYLIAFEPGTKPGWHSVEVRVAARTTPCRRAADMSRGTPGPSVNVGSHSGRIAGGSVMRKLLFVIPLVMLGAGSTACATKKFVRGEVGQVNTKVEGLSTQLEETQERTKKNEARIGEVDTKADAAGKSASAAQTLG